MIKAVVTGAGGRMGRRILALLAERSDISIGGAAEQAGHPLVGRDAGEGAGIGKTGIVIREDLAACIADGDVVIDFSHHEASVRHLEIAARTGRAIVIGSTGFTPAEERKIRELAPATRCVTAPNMSVGVNVMYKLLDMAARILGDEYDVEIVEAHHRLKKDAPSGTALKMARVLAHALGRDLDEIGIYARRGLIGERTKPEIGLQTVRAGDIVGEHTVIFGGMGERLEVIHRAHSRDNFARGAIRAALWVVSRPKGLYDMQDVLGLKDLGT
ncbi:MAG TPA: 4-hydroxy-tetrahydrodipicolinate reductase [Syntrophales bacterium]|nr:4-hydroxy-tetrahydrodipicolinate reductase [Syntrophales bacterium]